LAKTRSKKNLGATEGATVTDFDSLPIGTVFYMRPIPESHSIGMGEYEVEWEEVAFPPLSLLVV